MKLDLITVGELGRKEFPRVSKNDSLEGLLRVLERFGSDRAIVYSDDVPEGIVTKKDVISKAASSRRKLFPLSVLHVSSVMSSPLTTLPAQTPASKAARVMLEKGISSIPASEEGDITALLTKWEIVRTLEGDTTGLREVMSPGVRKLRESDSLILARKVVLEEGLSIVPVVGREGVLLGVITADELLKALVELIDLLSEGGAHNALSGVSVGEIMRPYAPLLNEDSTVGEAVRLMEGKGVKGVFVEGEGSLLGVVTLTDLVAYVVRRLLTS